MEEARRGSKARRLCGTPGCLLPFRHETLPDGRLHESCPPVGGGRRRWSVYSLSQGDVVQALRQREAGGEWWEAVVRERRNGQLLIHFFGWRKKHDLWIGALLTLLAGVGSWRGSYEGEW